MHPQVYSLYFPSYVHLVLNWLWSIATSNPYHKTKEEISAEIECILKAQEDPRHFGPIYEKYYNEIYVYVYKRVDEEYTAAEITSHIFFKCLSKLDKFKYVGVPFSAWLYRIAINEINQFFRKQKSFPRTVSVKDYQLENLFPEFMRLEPDDDKLRVIPELLSMLSPKDLQLVELRFFEQKSFKEIGFLLDITEINAKVRTYRILKKLQKHADGLNLNWDE